MFVELLSVLFLFLLIYYYLTKQKYEYWKKRGVPGPKPSLFVGNIGETIKMKKLLGLVLAEIYQNYPDLPFVGIFLGKKRALLVRDPEFIKNITVKDFGHFVDNDGFVDMKVDPILGRHPFYLKGDDWKHVRGQLTPCFTTAKMKVIFPLIAQNCQKFVDCISRQEDAFNLNGIEAKSLCIKYTLQNVSNIAFGVDSDCFNDPNDEFIDLARNILQPDTKQAIKSVLVKLCPSIFSFLSIKIISKDVENRLQELVTNNLNYREKHNIVINDFLNVLSTLKKTHRDFTDMDVTAHAAGFFGDGYETSSIAMSFVLFELSCNPEVQDKLRKELESFEEPLSYETLQGFTYLDAVVTESLRKNPPVFSLTKTCTKPYVYRASASDFQNISVSLESGTAVVIPVYALQHDSKYFHDPESFVPERFLDDNKNDLYKYTYLPFGEGPRMCLGQRFGLMQIKAAVAYVIKNFVLTLHKKTQLPLKLNPSYVMMSPIGGLWVNFEKVKN